MAKTTSSAIILGSNIANEKERTVHIGIQNSQTEFTLQLRLHSGPGIANQSWWDRAAAKHRCDTENDRCDNMYNPFPIHSERETKRVSNSTAIGGTVSQLISRTPCKTTLHATCSIFKPHKGTIGLIPVHNQKQMSR